MSGGLNIYGMIAGLGDTFSNSYDAARKRSQEDDAPELFGKLLGVQNAPASAPAITMGTLGQTAPSTPAAPTFATSGGAIGDYLKTTRAVESGGNDLAANPNSSAKGRYQFTDSTWRSVAKAHPELGLQPGGWKDPVQQEKAMAAFTSDNAGILSGKGIPINPGNLYVAHFLGAGGATKFIPGAINNPDAPAVAFVTPGAARANRSIFFNRDGSPKTAGEVYAERTGRFVNREPVATPALPAGGAVAGVPSMMSAGAPATMPTAPSRPTSARVPAFLGSRADGGFDPNAIPAAPTAVASAQGSSEADMPVAGAQPAQFQIPGQPAPAAAPAAAPVAQGFPGMGGGTSRISPEQAEILKAAWKNPNTRAMATSVYQSIIQGKDSPWTLQDVNGQSAWVNKQTQAIVPVGQAKRQTATVGNSIVDLATGQPIYSAPEKEDKFTYQSMPGVGMVALHPTNPDQSRVIIAGQQPRPLKPEERAAWGLAENAPAGMGADGKPFGIGGGKTEVNVDTKGAGKFAEKANEIQAKRYGEIVDAADRAVPLRADIETLANLGAQIGTGKLTEARAGMAQYAKAVGLDTVADGLTGGKLGEIEAYSALIDKLTPQMRVPGSGATSDREGASFKNSLTSLAKTPEGNAIIADTFRGMADYQAQAGDLAGKALRGEISQAEADQGIKALPSPYARFKEYQAAAKAKEPGAELKPVQGGRPPQGYTGGSYVDRAKKTLAARPDLKPQLQKMLSEAGIDPKRLDQ